MILRLVKMHFIETEIHYFKTIFEQAQPKILEMPGCKSVELKQDLNQPQVFFTLSNWESINDLENYRNSELFINTWKKVKPLFLQKAEAWTFNS
ncbi:putative quinol monooxygenase [Pedobacter alpinus]|uniref:Quinol monooxygenase n=1 Tax=Pedobacter alpinus TaxID=1590643 RepID=A0ABW5TUA6_9SPHI